MEEPTWANVLRKLQNAILDRKVYEALRVSYDFLETEEIRKFFLLCCLFPEDSDISIEVLLRYGVGRRLFEMTNDMHEARNEAYAHVEKLKNSNLLLASKEGHVKMHDLVRDFAIWIITASGKHVKGWPWPMKDSDSGYTSISLQLEERHELPNRLRCPNLELLRLVKVDRDEGPSVEFPEGFYEGMGKLQVIALGDMTVQSLPQSQHGLTSLRMLSLDSCYLKGDVSIIGNLQSLEILCFAHSDIEELPREIGKLTRLRLLDLTECEQLRTIAPGVLSSLTCLEELYMRGIAFKWEEEVSASSHKDESRASFNDVKKLAKLIALEINIPYEVLPTGLLFDNLKKFNISTAGDETFRYLSGVGNKLVLRADKSVLVEGLINGLCSKAVYLSLVVKDLKSLPEELEREGFSKLRRLELVSCGGLVCIGNSMGTQYITNIFPDLEYLNLQNLGDLEVLCRGQHSKQSFNLPSSSTNQLESFGKLKTLKLRGCNKLKSIFTLSIARNLINLEYLEIVECQMMEEIFTEGRGDLDENAGVGKIAFPRLKCLELKNLPNLVAFSKALVEVELPQLEEMYLDGLTKITTLYSGRETLASENDQHCLFKHKVVLDTVAAVTEIQPAQDLDESFLKLRSMRVWKCERLLNVFPSNMIQQLRNLQYLEVRDCCSVELVFDLEGSNSEEGREVEVLPQLKEVYLTSLPKLKHIVKGGEFLKIELPKLQRLNLNGLPNLVGFCDSVDEVELPQCVPKFGGVSLETEISGSEHHYASPERPSFKPMVTLTNLMKRVHNLRSLTVSECHSVEMVFNLQELNFDGGFQNLRKLCFWNCDSLRQLFTLSMAKFLVKLEEIEIYNCKLLEAIVVKEEGGEEDEEGILFPQLTTLYLSRLPKLLTLAPKGYSFNWSSITKLSMVDCGRGAEALTNEFSEHDIGPKEVDNLNDKRERSGTRTVLKSEVIQQLQNIEYLTLEKLNSIEVVFYLQGPPSIIRGFQNMKRLTLNNCGSLRHLFTSSMAKILVGLEYLSISDCKLLEAIIVEEEEGGRGEEEEEGILLPKLSSLSLKGMPNLLTIMPRNFNYSSLRYLSIRDYGKGAEALLNDKLHEGDQQVASCSTGKLQVSKMVNTVFSTNVIPCFHNLYQVQIEEWSSVEVVFDLQGLDVNKGHEVLAPALEDITLTGLPNLTNIWKGGLHNIQGFQNLESLEVKGCDNLRYLFTPSIAKNLVQLEKLKIIECKVLEAIVAEEEGGVEEEEELFPRLTTLYLVGLPKLMTITPKAYRVDWSYTACFVVDICGEVADTLTPIILNRQRVALATLTESDRTSQRTWPELVGLPAEEAETKIMQDGYQETLIVVVSEQALVNMSSTTYDVLIVVDSSGKVVRPPRYY